MSRAQPLYCKTSVWVYEGVTMCVFQHIYGPMRVKECPCACRAAQTGSSASYWLYVPKNDLLIRSSVGCAAHESFREPGSLSDPHQFRAKKPSAGVHFLLSKQKWGVEKWLLPMIRNHCYVNVAPVPGSYLIRMKQCSGWGGGGSLVVWRWKRKEKCLDFHRMACRLSDS